MNSLSSLFKVMSVVEYRHKREDVCGTRWTTGCPIIVCLSAFQLRTSKPHSEIRVEQLVLLWALSTEYYVASTLSTSATEIANRPDILDMM